MHGQAPEKTGPETGPPSYARRVRHIAESLEALSQLVTIGAGHNGPRPGHQPSGRRRRPGMRYALGSRSPR